MRSFKFIVERHSDDYLARTALAIDHDVRCWRFLCPRNFLCDRYRLINAAASP